jgi:hypothetical protein
MNFIFGNSVGYSKGKGDEIKEDAMEGTRDKGDEKCIQ